MRKNKIISGSWYFCEVKSYEDLTKYSDNVINDEKIIECNEATFLNYIDLNLTYNDYYIEFDGVYKVVEVYINNRYVGRMEGAYQSFNYKITNFLINGRNEIRLFISNKKSDLVYPYIQNGCAIIGNINIVELDKMHFMLDCPVIINTTISDKLYIEVLSRINCIDNYKIIYQLFDMDNNCIKTDTLNVNNFNILLEDFNLWDVTNPYLYTLNLLLVYDGVTCDEVSTTFGVRKIRIIDNKIYLNDEVIEIKGVCYNKLLDFEQNISIIKEMGINLVRFNYYPTKSIYSLCDKLGILVFVDTAFSGKYLFETEAEDNLIYQIEKLINISYNHPSVIFYGVFNNIFDVDEISYINLVVRINSKIKELNKTAITIGTNRLSINFSSKLYDICDINCIYLSFDYEIDKWLSKYNSLVFKPLIIGGIDTEGDYKYHSESPKINDLTEEFQLLSNYYLANKIKSSNVIAGNLFDMDKLNGLISNDSKIKKDVFYYYKSKFNKTPICHICGKRFINRNANPINLIVISNQDYISIFLNGKEYSEILNQNIIIFKGLMLHEGVNHIHSIVNSANDCININYIDSVQTTYLSNQNMEMAEELNVSNLEKQVDETKISTDSLNYPLLFIRQYYDEDDDIKRSQIEARIQNDILNEKY